MGCCQSGEAKAPQALQPKPKAKPSVSSSSVDGLGTTPSVVPSRSSRHSATSSRPSTSGSRPSLGSQGGVRLDKANSVSSVLSSQGLVACGETSARFGGLSSASLGLCSTTSRRRSPRSSREPQEFQQAYTGSFESCYEVEESLESIAWPDFANKHAASSIGQDADQIFERFRTCGEVAEIYILFAKMLNAAGDDTMRNGPLLPWSLKPKYRYPYEAIRDSTAGTFKARRLWDLLDTKAGRPDYTMQPCNGKRIVVVGSGPCGLRAAVELRLLGASVTVLEKRSKFDRINRLHLWEWCGEDLKELGARCLEPPPSDFGADPDLIHIGIGELQTLLFKTALLLGVCVLFGAEFTGVRWRNASPCSWSAMVRRSFPDAPGPHAPESCKGVHALVVGDGLNTNAQAYCGIKTSDVSCIQLGGAIGLVANFENTGSTNEKSLRCFNFARQFKEELFQQLSGRTKVRLENIVYTKSAGSHYFVMTPTLDSLLKMGIVKERGATPLLGASNINQKKLEELVRQVVSFPFKAEQMTLTAAVGAERLRFCDGGPSLFDFSKMKRAEEGATMIYSESSPRAEPLLFMLVGDALLEPFWPEGLGIIRGFFFST
mmetsp:Transcript_40125/g.87647  ORF Transcript_40125/g.87647 Transcript_40125/m.87647 type:complete len:603 (+) Transcript_40125:51-1859(+)